MKTILLKVKNTVSFVWRNSILRVIIAAIVTLLIMAPAAPLTAADLKKIPAVLETQHGLNLPKPLIVKASAAQQVATQQDIPTKMEKLFSIIVGIVFPVTMLALFLFLRYAPDPLTGDLFYINKS